MLWRIAASSLDSFLSIASVIIAGMARGSRTGSPGAFRLKEGYFSFCDELHFADDGE